MTGVGVDVVVGQGANQKHWTLPKALLVHHSPFFRAACDGQFKEAAEKCVRLPEEDPDIFKLFVSYLYTGGYAPTTDENGFPTLWDCTKVWVFGDKLGSVGFKNCAMTFLYAVIFSYDPATPDAILFAYEHTAEGSKLRKIYTKAIVHAMKDGGEANLQALVKDWDKVYERGGDFLKDVFTWYSVFDRNNVTSIGIKPYLEEENTAIVS